MSQLKYQRVLLKISGEGLCGPGGFGLDGPALQTVASQIHELREMGVQPAVVIGAGNFVRGAVLSPEVGVHRVTADQIGMLGTVMNALALQDVLEALGTSTRVLSAVAVTQFCEPFIRRRALKHLGIGRAIILAGGTGNPFFTTDTCAALRASEIQADVLVKATKVDGVYSADPNQDPHAVLYDRLTYAQVLGRDLQVMDHSAISLCRENHIDIVVCNLRDPGSLSRVVRGEHVGTLITSS